MQHLLYTVQGNIKSPCGSGNYWAPCGSGNYWAPCGSGNYWAPCGSGNYWAPCGSGNYWAIALVQYCPENVFLQCNNAIVVGVNHPTFFSWSVRDLWKCDDLHDVTSNLGVHMYC